MIASLRGKHDPHYKLAGRVEGLEKEIPRQLNQLHKTLSKSFGMQRKTLMRVLGLEERVAELEAAEAIENFEGRVIMITHNDAFCRQLCPERWVLEKGRLNTEGE